MKGLCSIVEYEISGVKLDSQEEYQEVMDRLGYYDKDEITARLVKQIRNEIMVDSAPNLCTMDPYTFEEN